MLIKKINLNIFFLIIFSFLVFANSPARVLADEKLESEDVLNLFTKFETTHQYIDRMFFSDDFKTEVIQKEFSATPEEYRDCMHRTFQYEIDEVLEDENISNYSSEISYTDKKILDEEHQYLEYDVLFSYFDYEDSENPELINDEFHDFSYFIKLDGEWYIDLMPEYIEKKDSEEPLDLCDADQIERKREVENAGLVLVENSYMSGKINIVHNNENISVLDLDDDFFITLQRGNKKYEMYIYQPDKDGKEMFVSRDFDWNLLKESVDVAQKITNILEDSPIKYRGDFEEYNFKLEQAESGVWKTQASFESNPKAKKEIDRFKFVFLLIDINSGTISEDKKAKELFDQGTKELMQEIAAYNRNIYMESLLSAGIETGVFFLLAVFIFFIIKLTFKETFQPQSTLVTTLVVIFIWLLFGFFASSKMSVQLVSLVPFLAWPFGILFGMIIIPFLITSSSILFVSFVVYRFLRKANLTRGTAILLVIIFSIIQLSIMYPLKYFIMGNVNIENPTERSIGF